MNEQNSVALITGASQGLGLSIARRYAARGLGLVLTSRRPDGLYRAAEELSQRGLARGRHGRGWHAHARPPVPTTCARRGALIAWARERGALIVEDDYDVEYRFGRAPMASLQGLAPDLVAFVGTTSKTLAPALRLAWVVPPSHLIDDVEDVLLVTGVTPPTLDQVAMASFIEDAALEQDHLVTELDQQSIAGSERDDPCDDHQV